MQLNSLVKSLVSFFRTRAYSWWVRQSSEVPTIGREWAPPTTLVTLRARPYVAQIVTRTKKETVRSIPHCQQGRSELQYTQASQVSFFACSLTVSLLKCYLISSHGLSYTPSSESGEDHGLLTVEYTGNAKPCSRMGKYDY